MRRKFSPPLLYGPVNTRALNRNCHWERQASWQWAFSVSPYIHIYASTVMVHRWWHKSPFNKRLRRHRCQAVSVFTVHLDYAGVVERGGLLCGQELTFCFGCPGPHSGESVSVCRSVVSGDRQKPKAKTILIQCSSLGLYRHWLVHSL